MNTILAKGKNLFAKVALATAALGGFLAFFGAGTASARPVVYVHGRTHAVIVGGFMARDITTAEACLCWTGVSPVLWSLLQAIPCLPLLG